MSARGKTAALRQILLAGQGAAPALPLDAPLITLFIDEATTTRPTPGTTEDLRLRTNISQTLQLAAHLLGPAVEMFILDGKGSPWAQRSLTEDVAPSLHHVPELGHVMDPKPEDSSENGNADEPGEADDLWEVVVDSLPNAPGRLIFRGTLQPAFDIFHSCSCFETACSCLQDSVRLHDCPCGKSHLIPCKPCPRGEFSALEDERPPTGGES